MPRSSNPSPAEIASARVSSETRISSVSGRGHDPRRLVHGDAAHVVADELDLADVDAGADMKILAARALPDRGGAVERTRRPVERREMPSPVVATSRPP